MRVYVTEEAAGEIAQIGERGFPHEICGLLLGKETDGKRVISALVPIDNSFEEGEQYHRYLITPDAMFRAEREARRQHLDVLGVYHSHPNSPARPSEYDRDHAAWTAWSYLIVSVNDGKAGDLLAWSLREDRSAFDPVYLEIVR
jgi:proteasome lid subunit RPN8/RPN11